MELKLRSCAERTAALPSSNRTFMELKYGFTLERVVGDSLF